MKLVKEHIINEKFTEDSDPIADMNIGMIHQIKKWMKSKGYEYEDKDNTLITCAEYGKTEFVRYLLDAGADVHASGDEALRFASLNGHVEVVKLLLNAGADVHAIGDYALRWASYHGRTEVVKLLLDVGADVHANDDEALRNTSYRGHTEVVKLLLDAGADVHVKKDYALRYASLNGHIEVVKLLLDAGADVHAYNDYALRYASYRRHTEVVKILLVAGADVHAYNDHALRYASNNGHTEVVKLLKDHIAKEKKLKKRIKESLNEKFTEESDPVHDLGIGIKKIIENSSNMMIIFLRKINFEYLESSSSNSWRQTLGAFSPIRFIKYKKETGELYLYFFSNLYRDSKTRRLINKVIFSKKLLKYANILQCIEDDIKVKLSDNKPENYDTVKKYSDSKRATKIIFKIKSEYLQFFENLPLYLVEG